MVARGRGIFKRGMAGGTKRGNGTGLVLCGGRSTQRRGRPDDEAGVKLETHQAERGAALVDVSGVFERSFMESAIGTAFELSAVELVFTQIAMKTVVDQSIRFGIGLTGIDVGL